MSTSRSPSRKGRGLRPLYAELAPTELFDLVVALAARGDYEEAEAALLAGELVWVRQLSPAFQRRYLATRVLVDAFLAKAYRYLGWLQALESLAEFAEFAGAQEGKDDLCVQAATRAGLVALACLRTAFEQVCSAQGFSATEVLVAFAPTLAGELETRREAIEAAGSHPELAARYAEHLRAAWEALAGTP